MQGDFYVVTGPSGAGKDTVIEELLKLDPSLAVPVSHTTRPQKEGEVDGVDYHFTSERDFLDKISQGHFLEYAEYVGNGKLYGKSWADIKWALSKSTEVILEVECQGARSIRDSELNANSVFIFLYAPVEVLRGRLTNRGRDTSEEIENRLLIAKREIDLRHEFDYVVDNYGHVTQVEAARAILSIIESKRLLARSVA